MYLYIKMYSLYAKLYKLNGDNDMFCLYMILKFYFMLIFGVFKILLKICSFCLQIIVAIGMLAFFSGRRAGCHH